jgi:hypothetical protein
LPSLPPVHEDFVKKLCRFGTFAMQLTSTFFISNAFLVHGSLRRCGRHHPLGAVMELVSPVHLPSFCPQHLLSFCPLLSGMHYPVLSTSHEHMIVVARFDKYWVAESHEELKVELVIVQLECQF